MTTPRRRTGRPRRAEQRDTAEAILSAATDLFSRRGLDAVGMREIAIAAGIDVAQEKGGYRETGSGICPTLNTAAGMNAYALTDRGTWLSFKNRQDLVIVVQGDEQLFNQYGVMLVNPAKHPHVKRDLGMAFIDWITSPEGQAAIAGYKIGGEQLFFPNYKK